MPVLRTLGEAYPTLDEIFSSVRVYLNDTFKGVTQTYGEGRVFTTSAANMWTPSITILNLATQALQRDLKGYGVKTTMEEIFYASIPPVNGPQGLAVPDPTVQCYLDFNGYWDGSVLHGNPPTPSNPSGDPSLPINLLMPLDIWERDASSNLDFGPISQAQNGLPSIYQSYSLGLWEWRGNAIYFNGAIIPKDMRMRYVASRLPKFPVTLDPKLFPITYIPFPDTLDVLALRTAYIFSESRLPAGGANELLAQYNEGVTKIAGDTVKRMQRTKFSRRPAVGDWFGNTEWGGGPA